LDASVVVSLLIVDAHSEKVDRWFETLDATVYISDLAALETAAVLSRLYRVYNWSPAVVERLLLDLDTLKASSKRSLHDPSNFALAETFVRDVTTKLAAADALHLATAKADGASLATFDVRLADAARAKGVEVADIG
jgi:predicted nucleic acid-binding protein